MNMQTKSRYSSLCVLAVLLGVVIVSGCAKKTVVGKWTGTLPGPGGMPLQGSVEFKEDGTASQVISVMGQSATVQGTYKYENDTLTETLNSISAAGQNRQLNGSANMLSAKVKLDGDSMTLTPPDSTKTYTLKRDAQ
jgi:hypothetical protein